jgi:hypothetical protein
MSATEGRGASMEGLNPRLLSSDGRGGAGEGDLFLSSKEARGVVGARRTSGRAGLMLRLLGSCGLCSGSSPWALDFDVETDPFLRPMYLLCAVLTCSEARRVFSTV